MVISFVIDLINDSISNFINLKIQKELSIGVLRKNLILVKVLFNFAKFAACVQNTFF